MLVNQNTKIGHLLKHHQGALEAITSVSAKFEKLRNPFLRKLMAGRTSISMAAKIAGCREEDFFAALRPLGFETESTAEVARNGTKFVPVPSFLKSLKPEQIISLDVRPLIETGKDPLKPILKKAEALGAGEVLKITNTFEPTPLIIMLKKKGFQAWTETTGPQHFETWFHRVVPEENFPKGSAHIPKSNDPGNKPEGSHEDWDQLLRSFAGKLEKTDVRTLDMPLPMIIILEALDKLPPEKALYVVHRKLPLFLLPELADRHFSYRSKELSENEVHLIIYREAKEE